MPGGFLVTLGGTTRAFYPDEDTHNTWASLSSLILSRFDCPAAASSLALTCPWSLDDNDRDAGCVIVTFDRDDDVELFWHWVNEGDGIALFKAVVGGEEKEEEEEENAAAKSGHKAVAACEAQDNSDIKLMVGTHPHYRLVALSPTESAFCRLENFRELLPRYLRVFLALPDDFEVYLVRPNGRRVLLHDQTEWEEIGRKAAEEFWAQAKKDGSLDLAYFSFEAKRPLYSGFSSPSLSSSATEPWMALDPLATDDTSPATDDPCLADQLVSALEALRLANDRLAEFEADKAAREKQAEEAQAWNKRMDKALEACRKEFGLQ
ncbi:hypothetical protein JCM8097_007730 [Rhodosporidiobolus ruineniae]